MTTAIVTEICATRNNFIVKIRTSSGKPVVFYGWNDFIIESVTPMPDGVYILDGRRENRDFEGQPRSKVGEIVMAFELMAVEMPAPEYRLKCENCGTEISEPNGGNLAG